MIPARRDFTTRKALKISRVHTAPARPYGVSLAIRIASGSPSNEITEADRKSTRLNSSHIPLSRMPSCFFNDTATTEIYTLSLHDALPTSHGAGEAVRRVVGDSNRVRFAFERNH